MPFDLGAALPDLLPRAIAWAKTRETDILETGESLNEAGLFLARRVGVKRPDLIRVQLVDDQLPLPSDEILRDAGLQANLFGPHMHGITLGYSLCIRRDFFTIKLLSHECRHVHQYEVAGGIAEFLPRYLQQVVQFGYEDAPYEKDARLHEISTAQELIPSIARD